MEGEKEGKGGKRFESPVNRKMSGSDDSMNGFTSP